MVAEKINNKNKKIKIKLFLLCVVKILFFCVVFCIKRDVLLIYSELKVIYA